MLAAGLCRAGTKRASRGGVRDDTGRWRRRSDSTTLAFMSSGVSVAAIVIALASAVIAYQARREAPTAKACERFGGRSLRQTFVCCPEDFSTGNEQAQCRRRAGQGIASAWLAS